MSQRDDSPKELDNLIVFIVLNREAYEGSTILEVCKTRDGAEAFCNNYIRADPRPEKWISHGDGWKNGCNYLEIERWDAK